MIFQKKEVIKEGEKNEENRDHKTDKTH